ncbi:sugar ABC transporter substrate-binding protein [Corallococcus exiguus]|uniref:polysaccharide biosynthesis/export family protein n=1 Tax=Corallococcus TaxID=83461 RepID=UPI000EB9C9A7|nr:MULTISPECIES: polysaccharide biosynthesis/export family protein [Corallococcus]NNB87180.1 sugar ABC transporter substrate-binding protein [Corallococcus exiguus]NNB95142.1 sugar ABC transporter substrate-binding protein [Corallococcus exiguus]NNC07750.1 sugar ABC transporter substrate-binding protein [Corallococcus exiguus]NPC48773.1 sugar ABC transporter substrate-binding protein [Corallococcus exiguus]RKH81312.1 sugar ABC transporter substrate-binding protein [Corallococcus sp. AB032C]
MGMRRTGFWTVMGMLLLSGCAHQQTLKVDNADQPYRIGREDVLDVSVWRDQELSRTVPVRPDGFISIPMVGEIQAAGKTPTELAEALSSGLTPYVQEPRVTVIVREVNSSRVFVTGEVAHPGAYPLRGRVSLLQAIALAGGFTDFANSDGIVVIRTDGKGGQIPVRYSDLVSPDGESVILRPGDTVVVP